MIRRQRQHASGDREECSAPPAPRSKETGGPVSAVRAWFEVACLFQRMVFRREQNIGTPASLCFALSCLALPCLAYSAQLLLGIKQQSPSVDFRLHTIQPSLVKLSPPSLSSSPHHDLNAGTNLRIYCMTGLKYQQAMKRACMICCRCHALLCHAKKTVTVVCLVCLGRFGF